MSTSPNPLLANNPQYQALLAQNAQAQVPLSPWANRPIPIEDTQNRQQKAQVQPPFSPIGGLQQPSHQQGLNQPIPVGSSHQQGLNQPIPVGSSHPLPNRPIPVGDIQNRQIPVGDFGAARQQPNGTFPGREFSRYTVPDPITSWRPDSTAAQPPPTIPQNAPGAAPPPFWRKAPELTFVQQPNTPSPQDGRNGAGAPPFWHKAPELDFSHIVHPGTQAVAPIQASAPSVNPASQGALLPGGATPPMPILPPSNRQVSGPMPIDIQQARLNHLMDTGSGISQIHSKIEDLMPNHPLLGKILGYGAQIPATIADVGASAIAPAITSNLPGTEYHHDKLVSQAQRTLSAGVADAVKEAQIREAQSRADLTHEQALGLPASQAAEQELQRAHIAQLEEQTKGLTASQQPLDDNSAAQLEAIWGPIRNQLGIKTPLFTPGMNPAQVQQRIDALKTMQATNEKQTEFSERERDRAETQKELQEYRRQMEADRQLSRESMNTGKGNAELDRISGRLAKPYQAGYEAGSGSLERIDLTKRNVDAGYVGQGLAIPELLTALVSGKGTGVRITQPELNAITRKRGIVGDAESWLNSIAGKGALTDQDKAQIKGVLQDAEERLRAKMKINSDALDAINGAASREDAVKADREARQRLNELETGSGNTPPPGAKVIDYTHLPAK